MPLCGKSLDMVWLAAQGHEVLGVELAPLAVEQFFAENAQCAVQRGLLITLDYPQEEMAGPPFSIADSEAQALFQGVAPAAIIDRRDILDKEPKFQAAGVSRLDTVVYRLGQQRA